MNTTKEHILKTSLLLFLRKSYRDVTMKEIVEKTGLSKGAFYHYFNSKEELFKEIANVFFSMGNIDYNSFPQNSLHGFYNHYLNYMGQSFQKMYAFIGNTDDSKTSLNFFLIMFEAISRFPEFLTYELEQYNRSVQAWIKVTQQARKSGEIQSASSDKQIADLFLYCTDGVFIRFVNSDKNTDYQSELQDAFDTVYSNLKV